MTTTTVDRDRVARPVREAIEALTDTRTAWSATVASVTAAIFRHRPADSWLSDEDRIRRLCRAREFLDVALEQLDGDTRDPIRWVGDGSADGWAWECPACTFTAAYVALDRVVSMRDRHRAWHATGTGEMRA